VFVSVFAAGINSYFLMTKIYESKASILSPREPGGGGAGLLATLAQPGTAAGQLLGGLVSGGGTSRDVFMAILKSRTMAQDLVDRFKLKEYYGAKYTEAAINGLRGATEVSVSKDWVITIKVEDKDPKLAADIANAYVTNLDRMFGKLGTTDGSRQRAFIEGRLEKTEKPLRQAEEALRRFQEDNKAIVIEERARRGIEAAALVKGQVAAAEVQLEMMRSFATENNPAVVQQKRQIEELKRQVAQMQYGGGMDLPSETRNPNEVRREFQVPLTRLPGMQLELVRLTRELKIQETVFTLLTQQLEMAKVAEARDTPVVQLLDRAVPAERKSKPITILYMAIAGALSLFAGIFLALILDYVERMRKRESVSPS
jgi:tyrosine-protein kinase Etk/Wzc